MFRNYLKVALRSIGKTKIYSIINILGLAVGMSCCVLIILHIQDELSFDRFHEKFDQIYRVVVSNDDSGQPTMSLTSYPVGPALRRDFPEVLTTARLRHIDEILIRQENQWHYEDAFFADSTLFDIFTFPLLAGDAATALAAPNSVVISEELARKYFGDTQVLGKTLSADVYNDGNWIEFKITGVMEEIPHNSHLEPGILLSFHNDSSEDVQKWGAIYEIYTYALLPAGYPANELQKKLDGYAEKHMTDNPWYSLHLQPLGDIRLHSRLGGDLKPGDINSVYTFSAIAFLILVIACINFMNLSTARSVKRAKEVGVRKVIGAFRLQLIRQFLAESMLLCLCASLAAIALIEIFLPIFNQLAGKTITLAGSDRALIVAALLAITFIVGLVSGSYPAFFLSSYIPAEVLKGDLKAGGRGAAFRKGLIVFQFAASIALIVCTLVVFQQLRFVQNKDLGFHAEQIVVARLNDVARQRLAALKSELKRDANVISLSASEVVPSTGTWWQRFKFGEMEDYRGMVSYRVDDKFLDTYGIELIQGRSFLPSEVERGNATVFLINEAAARLAGFTHPEQALAAKVERPKREDGAIVGTVEDFHLVSLRQEVYPTILMPGQAGQYDYLSVRIALNDVAGTLAHIERTWRELVPDYPFQYFFLDDSFAELYEEDRKLANILLSFSSLAIFVACLGLLGLSTLMAEFRTKEIGVRKVLGASVGTLVFLMSRDFTKWVLLANVIAWPLSFWAMRSWLQRFAFQTELGPEVFLVAGLAALVTALMTVLYQAVKVALANPVHALRYE